MKVILTIIILIQSIILYAQSDGYNSRERAAINHGSHHGLMTRFYNENVNYAAANIMIFAQDRMKMGTDTVYRKANNYIVRMVPAITDNTDIKFNLTFNFQLHNNSDLIKSCTVTGYFDYVIDFYVSYWPDKVRSENTRKDEIVFSYYMGDRISFSNNKNYFVKVTEDERYK